VDLYTAHFQANVTRRPLPIGSQ